MALSKTLAYIYGGLLGSVLGSFSGMLLVRIPTAHSLLAPRSVCDGCQKKLPIWALIPIGSFLWLRGKSHCCGQKLNPRYLLLECSSALWGMFLMGHFGWSPTYVLWSMLLSLLLPLVFLDLDYFWLPNELVLPSMMLGAILNWVQFHGHLKHFWLGLLPAIFLWLLSMMYRWLCQREGIGFGDIKLILALGLSLGQQAWPMLCLASLQGALIGSLQLYFQPTVVGQKPAALKDDEDFQPPKGAVAFGPFLILATLEILLFGNLG